MGDRVLELIIRAKDLTGRAVSKFRRNWRAARRTITSVTKAVVGFTAAITGAVLGLTKLTEHGEKIVAVQDAFARITGDSTEALAKLRRAAQGTISDFRLMALANQALTLRAAGSVDQFAEMVRLSRALGRAQGLEATDALEKFTLALARQSAQRADDLGLQLKGIEASKFAAEFMRQAREKADELTGGLEGTSSAAQRFTAAFANLRDRISVFVAESPELAKAFDFASQILENLATLFQGGSLGLLKAGFKGLGQAVASAFAEAFLRTVRNLIPDALLGPTALGGIANQIEKGIEAARSSAEAGLSLLTDAAIASRFLPEPGGGGGGGPDRGAGGFVFDPAILAGITGPAIPGQAPGLTTTRERRAFLARPAEPEPGIFLPEVSPLSRLPDPDDGADDWREAGEVVVASMSSAAAAVIAGSDNIAESMIRMITDIARSLPQVGGLTGAIIGGVGGIFGALFSRRRDPVPVRMADVDDRAARKLKDANKGPDNVTIVIEQGGVPIEEIELALSERQRRNATVRYDASGRPFRTRGAG